MGRPRKVTIIDETKPKAPKFEYSKWAAKNLPHENDSNAIWNKFLEKESEKWITGSDGLRGVHYFELTQTKYKDAYGQEIRPYWRDLDELIYDAYYKAKETYQDVMYIKRRESGLTTKFGGVLPIWVSLTTPGSINILTTADKIRGEAMFSEKANIIYNNLNPRIRPAKISTRQSGYLHFGVMNKKTMMAEGLDSKIILKETVVDTSGIESYRAQSIFIDEYFLHPKANRVRVSAQACVRKGFTKIAPIVLGGSCNETSKEGIEQAIKLWADADVLGIVTCFLPGWIGISSAPVYDESGKPTGKELNFCVNGHSDEKAASEWIMKRREQLAKAQDKTELLSFIKEYPLNIDEVFDVNRTSALGPEVTERISAQGMKIRAEQPPINTYDLEYSGGRIVATPNPKGVYTILERPQEGQPYISGTDPIPFNSENLQEGSNYACVIKKRLAQTYVAYYSERNLSVTEVCRRAILLQEYYNNAKTMMENNVFGAIKQEYKNQGKIDLLAKQPNALGIKFVSAKENFGYYKNQHTTERGIQLLVKYLLNHCDKIWFIEIIKQLGDFMVHNTDVVDAMIACEFYDEDLGVRGEKKIQQPVYKEIPYISRDSKGRTVYQYKKMRIK